MYSVTLDKVELSAHKDQNSYYKLQLLESDADPKRQANHGCNWYIIKFIYFLSHRYWIYRSWGRINENIGDDQIKEYSKLNEAVECFCTTYRKKTWNYFPSKCPKRNGMYYQIPTTSKPNENVYKHAKSTTLNESVQDLLKLLLNKDVMHAVMVKFRLDINKMPLGKIKRAQILEANRILEEIRWRIRNNESRESLVEASNRFYSMIPHKASSEDVLISRDDLNEKAAMLHSLRGIHYTYEFLHKSGESANILDDFYDKLNTIIEPLDVNSEQFQIIKRSVDDTKLKYNFEVKDIFKIQCKAEGESDIFKNLENRRLLWHGSKITNINLILAQGLKIAPPEAVIGCMFGIGLYFSDMIGNSAEYCYANQSNNIGIVLLCEVALGDSHNCFDPGNIELPPGKHSVHGVGKFSPKSSKMIDDAIIACGKMIETDDAIESYVDYNEFVVYNNQQVKIKYLVKIKFEDDSEKRFRLNF